MALCFFKTSQWSNGIIVEYFYHAATWRIAKVKKGFMFHSWQYTFSMTLRMSLESMCVGNFTRLNFAASFRWKKSTECKLSLQIDFIYIFPLVCKIVWTQKKFRARLVEMMQKKTAKVTRLGFYKYWFVKIRELFCNFCEDNVSVSY